VLVAVEPAHHTPPLVAIVIGSALVAAMLLAAALSARSALQGRRALKACPRCGARAVRHARCEPLAPRLTRVAIQCGHPSPSVVPAPQRRHRRRKDLPMTWFVVIVVPLLIVLAALTVVDVFRTVNGGLAVTGWVVLVVLLPVVGAFIYWVTRRGKPDDAEQAYLAQADIRRERAQLPIDRSGY
jgi:hypothetical protein